MQTTLLPSAANRVSSLLCSPNLNRSFSPSIQNPSIWEWWEWWMRVISHHSHRIQLFITARRTVWVVTSHGWTLLKPSWTSRKRSGFEKCCYPAYSPLLSLLRVKSVSLLKRIKETTDCVRLCQALWRAKNCSLYVAFFFFFPTAQTVSFQNCTY